MTDYNHDPVVPRVGVAANLAAATAYPNELLWTTDDFRLYVEQGGAKKLVGEADFLKLAGGTMTGNLTVSDGLWVGLGAAKGRIQFDDEATDTITFLNAYPIVQLDAALLGQFQRITTTTGGAYIQIQNAHRTIIGSESSAGASIIAGTLAYSTFLSSLDGDPLHLCVGNAPFLTIGATGGVHVGGTSDPGDNNLLVDGTIEGASIKATGAEQLKIWTYTHTVTAAEAASDTWVHTVTAVTLAKVRLLLSVLNSAMVGVTNGFGSSGSVVSTNMTGTTAVSGTCVGAAENEIISITIIEAV